MAPVVRMRSLTYVSTAHAGFDRELLPLLGVARRRNEMLDVSGRLLFSGGNVIHTIEGPDQWVGMLFDLFATDPRNWDIHVLLDEPVRERTFDDWSMGFRRRPALGTIPDGYSAYLHQRDPRAALEPTSAAVLLQRRFQENMR